MKINGKIVERPQHMIMRVCLGIHLDDFKDALGGLRRFTNRLHSKVSTTNTVLD